MHLNLKNRERPVDILIIFFYKIKLRNLIKKLNIQKSCDT
jgi:hypothetical protein